MNEKANQRYVIIIIGFLLAFIAILFQLVNLQIVDGRKHEERSQRRIIREREVIAPRGNIVDRNGLPIAVNRTAYTVQLARTEMKKQQLDEMLLRLINVLEEHNDGLYEKNLEKYLTFNPIEFGSRNSTEEALERWKQDIINKEEDLEKLETPEDVFNFLREEKFYIDEKYSDEEAYKIMTIRYDMLIKGYYASTPLLIANDVNMETVAQLEERHFEFPGVIIDSVPQRRYIDASSVAHVLGYIGVISSDEYARLRDEGYKMNDILGKTGIERTAEKDLRGINGQKRIEVDTNNRLTRELSSTPAIPGNDIVLTIDSRLQKAAMESLERNIDRINSLSEEEPDRYYGDTEAGSVVAIDVNSGEVIAMVSYPTYNPDAFLANDKEAQQVRAKLNNPDNGATPLVNRSIHGQYIPGSVYKPITAIAGVETGKISEGSDIIRCSGRHNIGGWDFECLSYRNYGIVHGNLDLIEAMGTSCNLYFHELGVDSGIDNIDEWAKYFGLGERTGIELQGEEAGMRANRETKRQHRGDVWRPADTAQASIGQFDNLFTPLQIANFTSTLANGGKRYSPHVIKEVRKHDGSIVRQTNVEYENLPLSEGTMDYLNESLKSVVNESYGTAYRYFVDFPEDITVAGKTGTPETSARSSDALFIAYAPADDPEIAVAVVIEKGVWGSNAVPVAVDVLKEYFGMNSNIFPEDRITTDQVRFTR
ncbi:penicillin-binding protein 2 [Herbivorax sp. ANBcel31]|uniref:penicillin-binding protein 2 n=1 Tax=Herbivorax sp. ANBcel31 TaxID=3069754 RepID=UPI0027B1B1BE|nr:penicillin-binding protein 2 [Herbivorax sp. ANBcel31]MDQ2086274.1 penicillin-binding protein 2 [Herbivorax sp. ANBcel31]